MPVDYCVSGIHLREIDQRSFLAVHCPTLLLTYNLHYGVKLFITYHSCKVSDIFVYPAYIFWSGRLLEDIKGDFSRTYFGRIFVTFLVNFRGHFFDSNEKSYHTGCIGF